ncbi:YqiA/YcfP family alpha/beta fold hydrolase [Eleftheria terrae]|uniref:YqiA/YcfP family alpha/beta fold hydrolase n=1 Tax=Eleftheria terrae TaxID=1597781 RepID=UPI00263B6234|nr:YqiA/YcfP family alpha/beta fold hydrolase [Eleftheria terrae]WKB52034.1 esterase [Eleftheria terrae]
MRKPTIVTTTHLLYLHGFRSSPQSTKARLTAARVDSLRAAGHEIHWWCPQLPPSPAEAVAGLLAGVSGWPAGQAAVIGSSLGGFYATVLAERLGWRAVLLNPAVDPARDLSRHIGEQKAWHSEERFYFRPEFVDELRTLSPPRLSRPERYFAVIAKGDELLDWREMAARYAGSQQQVLEAGDHALSDYPEQLDAVFRFLGLSA